MNEESPRIRLLLVDDEVEFLEATARALGRRGFDVDTARDAEEALALTQGSSYDVAVLDVKMPGMDGTELFRRLRARWPAFPVVMLTGHGSVQQAFLASREGVVEYLTKPCSVDTLAGVARDAVTRSASLAAHGRNEPTGQIRILLVDDDVELLESMERVLARRGMAVSTAPGGSEALVRLEQGFHDVVVLDVKMPGMDGLEVLEHIKRLSPRTEVLLLTGHPSVHNAFEGVRAGAFDYLLKPHGVDDLVEKIRAAYRHRWLKDDEERGGRVEAILEGKAD
jgi:DNA-binding NtrC family response regulator